MGQIIEHSGVISHINGKHIRVEIIQVSACSGCHAKGACTAADQAEKFVDVEYDGNDLKPGDAVTVTGQSSMGLFAVLLAFVLPFVLILITLFVAGEFTDSEAVSGTVSLLILLPYFLILSLFNSKLKSKLKFQIRKY
jgi:sigma-E factor negative regulatory protein RseC